MTQPSVTLAPTLGGFLALTQQAIEKKDWAPAINALINSLATEDSQLCFQYLFKLLPHFDQAQFVLLNKRLSFLLDRSPGLVQEQQNLALALAHWYVDHLLQLFSSVKDPLPLSEDQEALRFFSEAFQISTPAMHLFAKALQIGAKNRPDLLPQLHRQASQLFIPFIKNFSADFHKKLDSARRGGEKEFPRFQALLQQISVLKKFCLEDSHRLLFQQMYTQASNVLAQIAPEKAATYGASLISQGLLESSTFPLAEKPPTQRYREALTIFRASFQHPHPSVRELQQSTTEAFQTFFKILLDDALAILGPTPCAYDIRAMGSCGRKELCPFSDLEFMILIKDTKFTDYFKTLVKILELQIASLGETSTDDFSFTCLGPKNPSGLHIDMSPAQNPDLIRTPQTMAQQQLAVIDKPTSVENTLLKTFSLACNDKNLFITYQNEVNQLLSQSTSTPRTASSATAPTTTAAVLPTPTPPLLRREDRALTFFKFRHDDFKDRWTTPFSSSLQSLNLKTHFVELLNHLLSDMAIFAGLTSTNTLDIIDGLVKLQHFTPLTGKVLKHSVSQLYKIRLRLQLLYGQQNEEAFIPGTLSPYVLNPQEYDQLEKIYHLILVPFYSIILPQIISSQKLPSNLDLAQVFFFETFFRKTLSSSLICHFVQHLLDTQAPDTLHVQCYTFLSKNSVPETLRDTYLEPLKSHLISQPLLATLSSIPTPAGLRVAFRRSQETLEAQLLAITTPFPTTTPEVAVTAPSWAKPRYLTAEVIQQALDPSGHLRKSYPHSAHNVCRVQSSIGKSPGSVSYDLHLKEKPSHPLMEYAIHNLTSRIAGDLTPPTLLVRFDLKEQSYPVLVSQTIPGQSLKATQDLDKKSWTWHLLASLLTRPGDGRLSNYVVDQKKLYCIDNDISFVEPVITEKMSRKVQFAAAPFCLYPLDTPLDPEVVTEFTLFDTGAILDAWMDDIIAQEKAYTALFPEALRKKLHTEDPNNAFTPTILLREGTLATLNLQFLRLQNCLLQKKKLTSGELLQELLSLQEEQIGTYVMKAYKKASAFSLEKRLQKATSSQTEFSMTTAQYHKACLGKIPTFEEIEKKRAYGPEKARQEFFSSLLLKLPSSTVKIGNDQTTFYANFEMLEKDPLRQKWVLKACLEQLQQLKQPLKVLILNHCSALKSSLLTSLLSPHLEQLDLRYCSQINDSDVTKIATTCSKLKKLSLSGCSQITWVAGTYFSPELVFPQLKHLDLNHGSQLKTVNLQAPALKTLEAKRNPLLKSVKINKFEIKITNPTVGICLNVGEIRSVAFGASQWAEYIGDVGLEPSFTSDIFEILECPCPIFSGKKVKETHLLTLIPQTVNGKPLTLQLLGELVKKPLKGNATQFNYISLGDYKDPPAPASHWVLMSRDVIPGSRNQSYANQQALVKRLAEKSQISYEVPNILDVCVSLFMHYLKTGQQLHGNDPYTNTRCQEKYDYRRQMVAGGFSLCGLIVSNDYLDSDDYGVSVLRKFL